MTTLQRQIVMMSHSNDDLAQDATNLHSTQKLTLANTKKDTLQAVIRTYPQALFIEHNFQSTYNKSFFIFHHFVWESGYK